MNKNKKNYKYFSGNFKNITTLKSLTHTVRHAQVLDQFAFWSINSTFILPDETTATGWFCIKYDVIGERVGYSERTVQSIINKFVRLGLIEKVIKKINNETRACLRLTLKTLSTLNVSQTLKTDDNQPQPTSNESKNYTLEKNFAQDCSSKTEKNAVPYKEDIEKKSNYISNITTCKETLGDNQTLIPATLEIPKEYQGICNEVGELLTEREKKYLISTLENTFNQHNAKHSGNKGELFAEIAFSVLNKEHMPFAEKFEHRVNIIAKKLRRKEWRTPKGFGKYWEVGRKITKQRQARVLKLQAEKITSAVEDSGSKLAKMVSGSEQNHQLSTENAIDRFQYGFEVGQYQWQIEKELSELKKEKASILVQMRTIRSDMHFINQLIRNPEYEEQKESHIKKVEVYKSQLTSFNSQLGLIEQKMKQLLEMPVKETYSEEGERGYRALYEEAC